MDNFIQEIDEDIRRDRQMALWRKYGRYVVALALMVVIGAAATVAWRHYRASERLKDSMSYNTALALAEQSQGGSNDAVLQALRGIGYSGSDAYAVLARFQEAAILAKSGQTDAAAAVYDALAAASGIDQIFRDLAVLLRVQVMFDKDDTAALTGRLAPMTAGSSSAWRHSALELTALLAQRAGDVTKARDIYTTLADDPTTPRQMRGRAAEMLAVLGAANG